MRYCIEEKVHIQRRMIQTMKKILSKELLKVMAKKGAPIKELIDAYKTKQILRQSERLW